MPPSDAPPSLIDDAPGDLDTSSRRGPATFVETQPDEGDDAPSLVAALEEENPRKKLFELCASLLLAPPTVHVRRDDGATRGTVVMRVTRDDGVELTSGPCTAASRRVAELLAARALFASLEASWGTGLRAAPVEATEEATFKTQNPKGRLLELCTQASWSRPLFEVRPVTNGFGGTAQLDLNTGTFTAKPRTARQAKLVEHALAADLLMQVEKLAQAAASKADAPKATEEDARERLQELRLEGKLWHFGVDVSEPTPTGIVVCEGWLTTMRHERYATPRVEGRSKKDAERLATRAILALLYELEARDALPRATYSSARTMR